MDTELCRAAQELQKGQGEPLGGNVWKKRLDKNRQRSIVLNKVGKFWVFVFLFAKKDRENIAGKELEAFKRLSKDYESVDLDTLTKFGEVQEICNESDY